MKITRKKGFEGWYFHHQNGNDTISFIPSHTKNESFIQVISDAKSKQFPVSTLTKKGGKIIADNCIFSKRGCKIDLPGIQGRLRYHDLTPLHSDIMGPFQYLPMQCRHGIISMHHTLSGTLTINGTRHNYNGGNGYIELDRGTSFPRSYMWLQCNDFARPCSLMVAIAHIPFGAVSFTGCICALLYEGCEYRFATYNGVRILAFQENHICLLQGKKLLEINIRPSSKGHPLRSPVHGEMSGIIHESSNASLEVRLWNNQKEVLHLNSAHAVYEAVL